MWSYYGSKTNVVMFYPPPKHKKIIEPFAGSARYALKYWDRDVLLVDKYAVIIHIWKFLQRCSPSDILGLPRLKYGCRIEDYNFDCEEAKLLMGFLMGFSAESPRKQATIKFKQRPNYLNFTLQRIAKNLHKIKHWQLQHGSYEQIPNQEATWFIDPPYQYAAGADYVEGSKNINFSDLASWSLSRSGQIIVCEGGKADWLPFKELTTHRTRRSTSKEYLYTNDITSSTQTQFSLFT